MYNFSNKSVEKLSTVNENLQVIMYKAIERSPIDFGISHGLRTPKEQLDLFMKGRKIAEGGSIVIENINKIVTYCDGLNKKSKHQSGNAVDVYAYVNNKASWKEDYLKEIALVVLGIAAEEGIRLRWGGNFKGSFKDFPHYELIK